MRVLELWLAFLLFCAVAEAQFDNPDGLDPNGGLNGGFEGGQGGGLEGVTGANCYTRTVEVSLGICGSTTFKAGVCADDEDGADAEFRLVQQLITVFATKASSDEECETAYAEICDQTAVKAKGCNSFCDRTKVSVSNDFSGCQTDDQCPASEDTMQLPCCSYMRQYYEDICSYTDTEFGRLDNKIGELLDANQCANNACYSNDASRPAILAASYLFIVALVQLAVWNF
mmetsp:Transcript_51286/g.121474  ORF Transcript_51286/g.121474 Transcript_51286/m.121474 type:complete len:229 (+) Transcript_51286:79-765(+)